MSKDIDDLNKDICKLTREIKSLCLSIKGAQPTMASLNNSRPHNTFTPDRCPSHTPAPCSNKRRFLSDSNRNQIHVDSVVLHWPANVERWSKIVKEGTVTHFTNCFAYIRSNKHPTNKLVRRDPVCLTLVQYDVKQPTPTSGTTTGSSIFRCSKPPNRRGIQQ